VRNDAGALAKIPDFGAFAVAYAGAVAAVIGDAITNGKKLKEGKLVTDTSGAAASARHLAGAAILILEKFQIKTPGLKKASDELLSQEQKNPFFKFLANGEPTADMNTWIMEQCPCTNFDPERKVPRFQWSWERQDSANAATQTMYWDCIFAGDLSQRGIQPVTIAQGIQNNLPKFEDILKSIQDVKDLFEAQLTFVAKQVTELRSEKYELDRQLQWLTSVANAVEKGAFPKYDPKTDTVTLPAPPGTPEVSVDVKKGNLNVGHLCIGFHC
jgi:hypothetical protein